MSDWVLAVDVGGTKLAAARVAPDGTVARRRDRPTTPADDGEALWDGLAALCDAVTEGERPAAVGVGCGGPMRWPSGVVSPLNIPGWRDFPLHDRLHDRLGVPVVVHNDAIALALGEQRHGAGRGVRSFLAVVVSTGVGGGVVIDGSVVSGPSGNAGHVGHVVVDPDGPDCVCGGRGCLEAIARGPATVAWALAEGWSPTPGGEVDARALAASARAGNPVALAAFTRSGQALGVALASVAAVLDLEVVAVGGGVANAGELLLGPARTAFERHARLDFLRGCRLVRTELGNDAGLVGAGVLALDAIMGAAD